MTLYVQYGCGFSSAKNWRNFDASPALRFERLPLIGRVYTKNEQRFPSNVEYGDIIKGLPLTDSSCDGVYASHVLEHLSLADFRAALRNTYRILKPGGIFRLVVPDLETLARRYLESESPDASLEFMRATDLGKESRLRGIRLIVSQLGNSQHLWMWDYSSLENELSDAGFVGIRRCFFNDSSDKAFLEVEEESRFIDSVGIECGKKQ